MKEYRTEITTFVFHSGKIKAMIVPMNFKNVY